MRCIAARWLPAVCMTPSPNRVQCTCGKKNRTKRALCAAGLTGSGVAS